MPVKGLLLLSGGLDSTLAAKVMLEQGVELEAVNFLSPFCLCNRRPSARTGGLDSCTHHARDVALRFGFPFRTLFLGEEYLEMVRNPRHGYGSNLNPCLDCRILTFRKAGELLSEVGARFVVTGEVLGQRPMSQHRNAMRLIEKESGLDGLVLRPLSAQLLPPTLPERNGWVDRAKLLSLSGRSRRPQIALAEQYDINEYPCPAGGCLLTDPGFCRRMRDLMEHGELSLKEVELLKVGRHFRLSPGVRVVVGRNEAENERLRLLARDGEWLLWPADNHGPLTLVRGSTDQEQLATAASLGARYCDARSRGAVRTVLQRRGGSETSESDVEPIADAVAGRLRIGLME